MFLKRIKREEGGGRKEENRKNFLMNMQWHFLSPRRSFPSAAAAVGLRGGDEAKLSLFRGVKVMLYERGGGGKIEEKRVGMSPGIFAEKRGSEEERIWCGQIYRRRIQIYSKKNPCFVLFRFPLFLITQD